MRDTGGFNVIGYLSAASGLGEAGRNTARLLEDSDYPITCLDVELRRPVAREELPMSWPLACGPAELFHAASVYHINPDALFNELFSWRRDIGLDIEGTVNAIVPFWELPALPPSWVPVLRSMDAVLAPTRFVLDSVADALPAEGGPEVLHYPQAVQAPREVTRDRERWFPDAEDACVFLCSFDVGSDIARKNPGAAIAAFSAAFEGRTDVALVIKANGAGEEGAHTQQYTELRDGTAADPRIRWITTPLERADLWSLHASADAFVSLHRSEGLGLGLMESLAVGCPVVATGWSGNMDFMDDTDSLAVPYTLVPVTGATLAEYAEHTAEQRWAEPDVPEAARALRALADDPQLRARLGAAGREHMSALWSSPARRAPLDRVCELAAGGLVHDAAHKARVRHLEAAADSLRLRRRGVSVLRAMGLKSPGPGDGPPVFLGR